MFVMYNMTYIIRINTYTFSLKATYATANIDLS